MTHPRDHRVSTDQCVSTGLGIWLEGGNDREGQGEDKQVSKVRLTHDRRDGGTEVLLDSESYFQDMWKVSGK
jgi:hypothetical protein